MLVLKEQSRILLNFILRKEDSVNGRIINFKNYLHIRIFRQD